MPTNQVWCVDASVLLRSLLGESPATNAWFAEVERHGHWLFGSRMLELETVRYYTNRNQPTSEAVARLEKFQIRDISDGVIRIAKSLSGPLSGADAIHVATALSLGSPRVTLVTHDSRMARAAKAAGLKVHDPVTDDPNRGPVGGDGRGS